MVINIGALITLKVTSRVIEVLADHRIFIQDSFKNKSLSVYEKTSLEPYVKFYGGDVLCAMGTMSYIGAAPRHDHGGGRIVVGRYCSLPTIHFNAPRHPVEAVTTSPFGYSRDKDFIQSALRDGSPDGNISYADPSKTRVLNAKRGAIIGNDVWFGSDVSLNPGVSIGSGSIVAARSLVARDIGDYEIWGGNPAKFIKYRFPQEIIHGLRETEWWAYAPKDLARFNLQEPAVFIKNFISSKNNMEKYIPNKINVVELLKHEGVVASDGS